MDICPQCGATFTPAPQHRKRFCSDKCKRNWHNRAYRLRQRKPKPTKCGECGGPIVQLGIGQPRKFCSEICKTRCHRKRQNRARLPVDHPPRACVHCGEMFKPKRSDRTYCYDKWCHQAAYQQRRAVGAPGLMGDHDVVCGECGITFVGRHPAARWCSTLCANRHHGRSRSRRRGKIQAEAYTDRSVFDRDGWICYLCGVAVSTVDKWPHRMAPTIDHIVPISRGGPDTFENVACAHWGCNQDKGATQTTEDAANAKL